MAFPGPQILLAVGFAALSALMRATDTALTSLSTSRIAALLEQEPKHAASLRRWQASSHSMRASYVVGAVWAVGGTSIASFDAVSTLLPSAPETLHMVLAVLATLVLVAPAAFIGVSIALREPEIWGPKLATFLRVFEWVFWPIAKPIAHVAEWIAEKWSPEVLPEQAKSLTSAEVEYLVDEVERAGVVSAGPAEMLRNVLEFEELSVRDVMVARTKVEAIDISMPLAKVRELVAESGHSRYPVYEGDLDEVVGLLVAKDVFKAEARSDTNLSLGDVVRSDVIFVHEAQSLASVLREMRLKRQHMAVVVDEFGGTSGVATLEDVIERIVGDIRDEHDDAEGAPIQDLNGRLFALPTTPFGDVSAYLGVGIAESLRDASVGALLLDAHPQPKPGHSTEHHGVRLVVRGVAGNEIQRIEVIRLELDEDAPPKSEEREAS